MPSAVAWTHWTHIETLSNLQWICTLVQQTGRVEIDLRHPADSVMLPVLEPYCRSGDLSRSETLGQPTSWKTSPLRSFRFAAIHKCSWRRILFGFKFSFCLNFKLPNFGIRSSSKLIYSFCWNAVENSMLFSLLASFNLLCWTKNDNFEIEKFDY